MQHLHMSRSEVMNTPTYERRFYLDLLRESIEEQKEAAEGGGVQNTGQGRRSRTISGPELKAKLKNNEIPDE